MKQSVFVIVTDVGEFPPPPGFQERVISSRKRKDGRPDLRFKEGKELMVIEREFCVQKTREYMAA